MRAVRYHAYGGIDRLRLEEVPPPAAHAGHVRVAVVRAALNPKDALFRKGKFRIVSGGRFPKTPGLDFAGRVMDDPSGRYSPGSRVFGMLNEFSFLRGTLADEVLVAPHELTALPDGVGWDDGAAVPLAGLTALQAMRDVAGLRAGQRVLINGASGGVGTLAVQLARVLGAEVTTVSSAANRQLCASLGAHRTIAYDDGPGAGDGFDVVFDVYGNLSARAARRSLVPRGVWVGTVPTPRTLALEGVARVVAKVPGASVRERLVIVKPVPADLDALARWMLGGEFRAVVDLHVSLERFAEAFARLESKRTRGKIVVGVREA